MGINTTLTRGSVILTQGGAGAWDEGKVGPFAIVKRGASDYRGWFEGLNAAFSAASIGYATSTDGSSWTKSGSNPVFTATETWENGEVAPGTVIWDEDGSLFKMWYHGGFNSLPRKIGYATSTDGISWTRGNSSLPVLSPGSAGAWDESSVADACVLRLSATDYRMWYIGKGSAGVNAIGYATSTDGISWTKESTNPVFERESADVWDDNTVYGLCVRKRANDTGFWGWYAADKDLVGPTSTGIGLAYSADGINWVRAKNNPILVGTTSPEEWISDPIWVLEDPVNQTIRVYYYYDDFSVSPAERSHREATGTLVPTILTQVESVRTGTTDPHTFSVTPQGEPKGIVLTAIHGASSTDHITGAVTYGGVALSRVVTAADTVGEPGRADIWFLGSGIPTGTQTVSIDLASATTDDFQFCCFVLYANGDMEAIDSDKVEGDAANPSVTLQYASRTAMAFGALYGGGAAPSSFTPNADCVTLFEEDLGAFYAEVISQATPGSSDFAIGGTSALDDVAFAAAAFGVVLPTSMPGIDPRRARRNVLLRT